MTNEMFLLYLLTRLNSIQCTLFFATAILGAGSGAFFINGLDTSYEDTKAFCFKSAKRLFAAFCVTLPLLILSPSKEDAMFIMAGTGVIEAAKSDTAQRIAGKSVKVIENYLDKLSEANK